MAQPTISVTITLNNVEPGQADAFRNAINNNSSLITTAINQIVSQVNSGNAQIYADMNSRNAQIYADMVNTVLSSTQPVGQKGGDFWLEDVTG